MSSEFDLKINDLTSCDIDMFDLDVVGIEMLDLEIVHLKRCYLEISDYPTPPSHLSLQAQSTYN